MKCELMYELKADSTHATPGELLPVGTILDHPEAWVLVRTGAANPADDECRAKAGLDAAELKDRHRRFEATAAGIVEEDRHAFFAGEMVGYNPDGSWKPGPNFVCDDDDDEEYMDHNDNLSLLEE